jgi:glycosyltransferase involved in cell wall biosynthesis
LREKRLGVYIDVVYRLVEAPERRISTDRSFLLFVEAVGGAFDELILFGRVGGSEREAEYVLSPDDLVPLPHYPHLRDLRAVARSAVGTLRALWRGVERIDVLWAFGPHPFTLAAALIAIARGKEVVLGVRQHSVRLYAVRVHGWKRPPAVGAMWLLDSAFRLLSRHALVSVQGEELGERYARAGARGVLTMTESVVRARDVAADVPARDWSGTIELLTVGRLETEKNPLLLVEALAELERKAPGRYRLTWVGRGPLEPAVRECARELGVDGLITLIGYVAFGAGLLDLYRRAHVFVHVSLSEGMPKVLIEALACGTPIVATDVGGVRAALGGGSGAILVPPDDRDALVEAIERVTGDPEAARLTAEHGLELALGMTLEAEAERVVAFIEAGLRT